MKTQISIIAAFLLLGTVAVTADENILTKEQIEQQAAQIRKDLKTLTGRITAFQNSWETLGSHIRNASTKYEEAHKKLDQFSLQLSQIQRSEG